ncbi:hypothetical protein PIROE2DRAFT_57942 [Piromyces sp. E2]|nr:hypothetical protein PIROE2DRAFT_57942 [Piromyces sp. E2]|eukprot:OUM68607.1 hypothetical protein PIROE2DRAFT_57942 [Piromyces sp. E2]
MMIIIACLLSVLIEYLLRDILKTEKYEYCSNEFTDKLMLPNTGSQYKKSDPDVQVCHYNSNSESCSYWFGSNDHFESFPYDIIAENNEKNINRDTIFIPSIDTEGKKGHYEYLYTLLMDQLPNLINSYKSITKLTKQIKNLNNNNNYSKRAFDISKFATREALIMKFITDNIIRPWGFVAVNKHNVTEKALIGERKEELKTFTMNNINSDEYTLTNKGYLDYTYSRYMLNMASLTTLSPSFERVPYFEILEVENAEEVDDLLVKRIKL